MKTPYQKIGEYNGQNHVRGTVDCNLLFLQIHEPEMYDKLYGKYSTIIGGVRSAKRIIGYRSVRAILDECGRYEQIDPLKQLPMDIVVFEGRHDVYMSLGNKFFGVNEKDKFSIIQMHNYTEYLVYRKKEK